MRLATAAVLLAACLGAGCFGNPDCTHRACSSWQEASPLWTVGASWEGLGLDGQWQEDRAGSRFDAPVVALDEDGAPTPLGGGGQEVAVAAPPAPSFTVRIGQRGQIPEGAVAVWGLTPWGLFYDPGGPLDAFTELARGPLEEPFVWTRDLADDRMLVVRVEGAGGEPIAYSWQGLEAVAIAGFTFDGQVQPVHVAYADPGLPGSPPDVPWPVAAEDMNDRFTFGPWVEGWEWAGARTALRGDWSAGMGSDVALALLDGGGRVKACSQDDLDAASAAQADEAVEAAFWTFFDQPEAPATPLQVWVGFQDWWLCTQDATYQNPGPVPYHLEVWLSTDWMETPDV